MENEQCIRCFWGRYYRLFYSQSPHEFLTMLFENFVQGFTFVLQTKFCVSKTLLIYFSALIYFITENHYAKLHFFFLSDLGSNDQTLLFKHMQFAVWPRRKTLLFKHFCLLLAKIFFDFSKTLCTYLVYFCLSSNVL